MAMPVTLSLPLSENLPPRDQSQLLVYIIAYGSAADIKSALDNGFTFQKTDTENKVNCVRNSSKTKNFLHTGTGSNSSNFRPPPLFQAIEQNKWEIVRQLITCYTKEELESAVFLDHSPEMYAVLVGNCEIFENLCSLNESKSLNMRTLAKNVQFSPSRQMFDYSLEKYGANLFEEYILTAPRSIETAGKYMHPKCHHYNCANVVERDTGIKRAMAFVLWVQDLLIQVVNGEEAVLQKNIFTTKDKLKLSKLYPTFQNNCIKLQFHHCVYPFVAKFVGKCDNVAASPLILTNFVSSKHFTVGIYGALQSLYSAGFL